MAEVVELSDLRALSGYLKVDIGQVNVKPYCYDDRTGWKTYLVTVGGHAVGFTDGPCTEPE